MLINYTCTIVNDKIIFNNYSQVILIILFFIVVLVMYKTSKTEIRKSLKKKLKYRDSYLFENED